jgi:phosphoglycerate dehydrogenase-like enzyme
VVDEAALYQALKVRRIAGAGLDVYQKEPTDRSNPLFTLDNVAVRPGSSSVPDREAVPQRRFLEQPP